MVQFSPGADKAERAIDEIAGDIDTYQLERTALSGEYDDAFMGLDAEAMAGRFAEKYTSFFARLGGAYRRDANSLKAVRRDGALPEDVVAALRRIAHLQTQGTRIDAWTDLAIQLLYLAGITALLVYQHREALGVWRPGGAAARLWRYNVEALHFMYGGLLSAYVVLYLKSSTNALPAVFLGLLVGLMLMNEFPFLRRAGHRMRLGLHAFCVMSFLNYFIPIVVGRIDAFVFVLSLLLAMAAAWRVADWLAAADAAPAAARLRLFAPAALVCLGIGLLYVLKVIPPVPLSVQFHGIYHDVRREGAAFALTYPQPPLWSPWRSDSRPFEQREGDRLFYFTRVFAPTGFRHEVMIRWDVWDTALDEWVTTDRIPLSVVGGRGEGFRGTAAKSNFWPGRWRVTVETADGRAIATLSFRVTEDRATGERVWRTIRA